MPGKGDTRRPPAVPQHTIDDNWSRTFPNSNTTKPKVSSSDMSPATSAEVETTTPSTATVTPSALDAVPVNPRRLVDLRHLLGSHG